ncbi:major facilitator superfamily domain-containing protein [Piptocephalis cylindrospora]|uniref:Major facilitator superfamily domain-containing protein n=1 Tax=Piptocephalis cylindrospora TaxID=1907219 RepID=A0A4P9XYG6_9FUNG|nr:major facilitator superfamily domain-containing protein [Piptocephalis cylindrospora]|eukprot:RKP11478.1 major facilitator superfamily domain-containing protein [Piptocephalis cylindrospora]
MEDRVIKSDILSSTYPPDHPRGWFMIALAFMAYFIVDGYSYAWGLYQRAYVESPEYAGVPTSTIALIGSVCLSTIFGLGLFVGTLIRYCGIQKTLLAGTICFPLGLLLASFATAIWHLFLTQALLSGIGGSLIVFSISHLPSQWFNSRRGIASGLAYAGSCIGSVVQLEVTEVMLENLGIRWSLRIMATASFVILLTVTIFIRERLPPSPPDIPLSEKTGKVRGRVQVILSQIIDYSLLSRPRIILLMVMCVVYALSYMAPFFFLPSYASYIGLSNSMGTNITTALALSDAAGRIVLGLAADRFGALNLLIIACFIVTLTDLILWPLATSAGMLLGFAIIFGFFQSAFVSILPIVTASLVDPAEASSAIGLVLGIGFVGDLAGSPIFGALFDITHTYLPSQIFAGSVSALGTLLLLPLRFILTKSFFKKI